MSVQEITNRSHGDITLSQHSRRSSNHREIMSMIDELQTRRNNPCRKKAKTSTGAPQDYGKCKVGCYIWGKKLSIMLDCLVLGYSLSKQNTKPARVICCDDDTLEMNACPLLAAFWEIIPVNHAKVPDRLQG